MRVLMAFLTLFLSAPSIVPAFAEPPRPAITQVGGTAYDNEARIHFRLENALPPEMVEALKSGIEISFRISVKVERVHRNWFDVKIGDMKYRQSIRYDVLARAYRLRQPGGDEILPDLKQALDRMTRFQVTVPLDTEVTRGKRYRASVKARLDRAGLSEPLKSIVFFSSMRDVETEWAHGPVTAP